MSSSKISALAAIVVLAATAALVNLHAPTAFFDSQIMLGGTLAVFALLQYGWAGLLVGAAALTATALRWGHPFELIIGMLFLLWLKIFLDRLNGGWSQRDNGRIVLAAAGFWLIAGLPLEILLFHLGFGLEWPKAIGIGLKESVTGLFNTTLGFLLYLTVRWWATRHQAGSMSARGVTFAVILAAITIPGISLILTLSSQLKDAALDKHMAGLRAYGLRVADLAAARPPGEHPSPEGSTPDKDFILRRDDGRTWSSDPELFRQLESDYVLDTSQRTGQPDLGIYRPDDRSPVILADADSYWVTTFEVPGPGGAASHITVVETTPDMVRNLDFFLLIPSFSLLLGLLTLGAVTSELLGRAVDRQFTKSIQPLSRNESGPAPPELAPSRIRELNTIISAVNERSRRIGELGASLQMTLQAEQSARQDIDRVLANLPIAIATNSLESPSRLLYLNKQFVRTFGYTQEDIPTVPDWAVRAYPDPDYRREVFRIWDEAVLRAIEVKGSVESMEFEVVTKDGRRRQIIFGAVVMEDRLLVSQTDVTDRRKVEAELRSAREELQRVAYELTENIPVGTYTMVQPPDGGVAYFRFVSTRFLELTGLEREQARESPLHAFARVHPDDYDDWVRKSIYAFEHKRPFYETCRVVVDGVTRWITAESTPRELPDGSVVWEGVLTDVTARQKAEDELAAARRREKEIERETRALLEKKLKTSLNAAAVAHEINQPLSRILLRAQTELQHAAGAERVTLQALVDDARRVVTIIEKMRVLLRNVETIQHPVDLPQVIASALFQVKGQLRDSDVSITNHGPTRDCLVEGDDVQLQMVLTNLIRNAIEAIDHHACARREITLDLTARPDTIELAIGDSGPGWPGGTLEEMLLRTTKTQGAGIGLYVVKTALEHHHGHLTIGRSPLGGAEFRLTFPRFKPANA